MDIKLVFSNKVYADVTIDDDLIKLYPGPRHEFIADQLEIYIEACLNRLFEQRNQDHET